MDQKKQFADTKPIPVLKKRKTKAQWISEAQDALLEFDKIATGNSIEAMRKLRNAIYAVLKAI